MNAVVLVHGLWLPGSETFLLRKRLRKAGFSPSQYSYRSVSEDLTRNAARLAEFLRHVEGDTVHLVGHSLGGVVMLNMLERHAPERIGRLVCLASPLRGSSVAHSIARFPGGAQILGKSIADLQAGRSTARWSGEQDLGIIAGDFPLGAGQWLGRLPSPHDGTVAVEETKLEGATDHLVLPVSHLAMLWSRDVLDQVVSFLRAGHFQREGGPRRDRASGG